MRINSIGPTFKGDGDVIIRYNDGANAKNQYVNNIVSRVMDDLRKERISTTVNYCPDRIEISSPPKKMISALAKTNLICRIQRGSKLKLIV